MKKILASIYLAILSLCLSSCVYYTHTSSSLSTVNREKYPMSVCFIDVGQGDSTFITLPDNKTMLIDAGTRAYSDDVSDYISSNGYEKINFVVATHPHSDHIGGLADILLSFDADKVFMPEKEHTTNDFENLLDAVIEKDIPVYKAEKGAIIEENSLYKIQILSPENKKYTSLNNYSAVVKITYGETEFLFMGDAERKVETPLKKLDIESDIIKLGHHGSDSSSGYEFLTIVSPKYAVISCGENNSYNHPHKEIINRLNRLQIPYFRTDRDGNVLICADDNENFFIQKEYENGYR